MTALKTEETNLIISSAGYNTIQDIHENNLIRLKQLAYDYHINNKEKEEEKDERTKQVFETRLKLNLTMQKTIEEFDKNYQSEEKIKLENEAEIARQKRAQLNLEFDTRTKQIENLIKLQQKNYDENCRITVERDVIIAEIQMQQEKASQLYDDNNINKIKVNEINDIVKEYDNHNEQLRYEIKLKQDLLNESNQLENQLNDTIRYRQKLINIIILSSQNLVKKSLDISNMITNNKAADLLLAAAALSIGEDDSNNDNNDNNHNNDNNDNNDIDISDLIEEAYDDINNNNNNNSNIKPINTIDFDTDIVWNSRREENYQMMSDSIRKFLRKKKRM